MEPLRVKSRDIIFILSHHGQHEHICSNFTNVNVGWCLNGKWIITYYCHSSNIWKKVSKVTDCFHFVVAVLISLFFFHLTCSIIITIIDFFLSTPSFRISNTCPINSQLSCPSAAKLPLVLFFLKARFLYCHHAQSKIRHEKNWRLDFGKIGKIMFDILSSILPFLLFNS